MGYIIRNTILNITSGKVYSYSLECLWYVINGEIDLLEHVQQIIGNFGENQRLFFNLINTQND